MQISKFKLSLIERNLNIAQTEIDNKVKLSIELFI